MPLLSCLVLYLIEIVASFAFFMAPNMFHGLFGLDLPVKERKTLERQQKEREELLLPIYQQVTLEFAWKYSVSLDGLN